MVIDQMGKIADVSKWQGNVNWSEAAKELDLNLLTGTRPLSYFVGSGQNEEEN